HTPTSEISTLSLHELFRSVIMSYETARSEIAGVLALLARRPTALVFDESHATKNRWSLTSTAARHFALRAEYRWLLSGTPVTNRSEEHTSELQSRGHRVCR